MKIFFKVALLFLFISCNSSENEYSSLKGLQIITENKLNNGNIDFEVIGTIKDFSRGANDLENSLEKTLNLQEGSITGCLVLEENYPEKFGFFMFDPSNENDYGQIKLGQKAIIMLTRIKLLEPIEKSIRNQKNIEYLYLVTSVKNI